MSEETIRKTYVCPMIGTGTDEDPRRPKIADLSPDCSWFIHELEGTGYCFCTVVAPASEHDKIALDPNVRLIAMRGEFQIPEGDLVVLRGQYADFDLKFETVKKCWVRLNGETGE